MQAEPASLFEREFETWTDEEIAGVAERFCPVFHLHPGEKHWPLDVDSYVRNAELWVQGERVCEAGMLTPDLLGRIDGDVDFGPRQAIRARAEEVRLLDFDPDPDAADRADSDDAAAGGAGSCAGGDDDDDGNSDNGGGGDVDDVRRRANEVFQRVAARAAQRPLATKQKTNRRMRLHEMEKNWAGFEDHVDDAPVYAHMCNRSAAFIEICYLLHFGYNAPYKICCFWEAGAHHSDWEHMTVRVSKRTGELHSVRFSSHGYEDGYWRKAGEFDSVEGTRPVVFVARGSHALYHSPGCWPRICCVANDYATQDGVLWRPRAELVADEEDPYLVQNKTPWLFYNGLWAPTGIKTPSLQKWWHREAVHNNSWFRRVCCAFWPCVNDTFCLRLPDIEHHLSEFQDELENMLT